MEANMEKVVRFLKDAGTYYLATMDGDQPRVRPFGTVNVFEGKLYIQTGKIKDVSRQISRNPLVISCPELPRQYTVEETQQYLALRFRQQW
jgi:uncharacterized pyridoxamine 5'-phosphate oxidase family protein